MAATRKTGQVGQIGENSDQGLAPPDIGVSALARSALDRLTRTELAVAGNTPPLDRLEANVGEFAAAIVAGDMDTARGEVQRLIAIGASYEWISDRLIAEAARYLGQKWEESSLSFIQVSLGISELLRINTELRRQTRGRFVSDGVLALFATIQGQSHNLGIILAAEAFRQHGWDVEMMLDAPIDSIVIEARVSTPAFVGLTVGRNDRKADISRLLRLLKEQDPPIRTMLGGHGVAEMGILEEFEDVDEIVTSIEDGLVAAGRFR